MKTILIFIVPVLLCLNTKAQKLVEENVLLEKGEQVTLKFDFADNITFNIWDKNEVNVKVRVDINQSMDNEAYYLHVDKNPVGIIRFEEEIKDMEKLKNHQKVYDEEGNRLYLNCNIDLNINYEVFLPAETKVNLKTISGNIKGIGLNGDLDLRTISGDIDLTFPESTQADLDFSTISGEMYTNFEFNYNNNIEPFSHHYIKSDFQYELNGGGRSIDLTTISGNIYFRKQ